MPPFRLEFRRNSSGACRGIVRVGLSRAVLRSFCLSTPTEAQNAEGTQSDREREALTPEDNFISINATQP